MRPSVLNPLFAAITTLPGVGAKLEKLYGRLLGRDDKPRVIDLLFHMPTGVIDRRARPKLRDAPLDTVVTVVVTVDRHRPPPPQRPRAPYQVYTSDETGDLTLTFFNARKDYLQKLLPVGERRYVSGIIGLYEAMRQMVHPDRVIADTEVAKMPPVEPVYPLTEGLIQNARQGGRWSARANTHAAGVAGAKRLAADAGPTFAEALRDVHRPTEPSQSRRRGPRGQDWGMTNCSPANLRWR